MMETFLSFRSTTHCQELSSSDGVAPKRTISAWKGARPCDLTTVRTEAPE
jgi:hypothetical protein